MVLNVPTERPLVLREFRNGAYCAEVRGKADQDVQLA